MRSLLAALVFYTILPLGGLSLDFQRIARWLPLVGLVIGLLVAGIHALAGIWFSPLLSALFTVVFWAWLTGGLHLDGLMDAADGWAAGPERALAVMSDSRIGAYALIAAFAVLTAKVLALAELDQAPFALIWATVAGRWGQLIAIGSYAYLKPVGKGRFLVDGLQWPGDGLLGTAFLAVVAAALFLSPAGVAFTLGTAFAAVFCGWVIARRFGGQTGDTYGAIVEISEALVLVAATLVF